MLYSHHKGNRLRMAAFSVLPGTTPLVAIALIDMAVSIVCKGKEK